MVDTKKKYLDPQTLSKLDGLQLRARKIIEGYVSGPHRSPYHGFSIEFTQHRQYVPGDDLRHVDWKVFGRTDKVYLKQYEEETNLVSYLLLDTSESMLFQGEHSPLSKLDYAKCIAASLAYLVLQQQDSVGLATFDTKIRQYVQPSGQPSHLKQLLHTLEQSPGEKKTSIGPLFHDLAERFKKRGIVVILSDLFDDPEKILAGIKHFRHRQHDVIVFHILDVEEREFPFNQMMRFRGLEHWPDRITDPRQLRQIYLREMEKFLQKIAVGCRGQQVDYVPLLTDQSLDIALSSYLAGRMVQKT
ncbi:MAG: DUF58 domain-containing protein [Planctomycetaceae bacterium TMED10]|nr:MAG: DUF58 domain-containing protein [Planctomycetaceae bacterium TMED10]